MDGVVRPGEPCSAGDIEFSSIEEGLVGREFLSGMISDEKHATIMKNMSSTVNIPERA